MEAWLWMGILGLVAYIIYRETRREEKDAKEWWSRVKPKDDQ